MPANISAATPHAPARQPEQQLTPSTGIALSIIFQTSIPTSVLRNVHSQLAERSAYFARKSNIFNRVFVKNAWGWTVAAYLFHLLTAPGRPPNSTAVVPGKCNPALHVWSPHQWQTRSQRMATLVLASLAWIAFTAWMFGAGLNDRIIQATGGECAVPLRGLANRFGMAPVEALIADTGRQPHVHGDDVYLPLPNRFCQTTPLSEKNHPHLFNFLRDAHGIHERVHAALRLPPPRWSGGFDVSGHAFLLTLGALILASELAPSWRSALAKKAAGVRVLSNTNMRPTLRHRLHVLSTIAGTALLGLWVWMLFMTAIYFHDPDEKLAGLALGLIAAFGVHLAVPRQPTQVVEYKVRGPTRRPSPKREDSVEAANKVVGDYEVLGDDGEVEVLDENAVFVE